MSVHALLDAIKNKNLNEAKKQFDAAVKEKLKKKVVDEEQKIIDKENEKEIKVADEDEK